MVDKITVRRANVVFDISPVDKNYYMAQGFSVVNEAGEVIEQAMSQDVGELQVLVNKLKKELDECITANDVLRQEIADLQNKLAATNKSQKKKGD